MDKNRATGLAGVILLISMVFSGCKHESLGPSTGGTGSGGGNNSAPCDPNKVYFQQQVLPILVSNCAMTGCHDEITREEDVILTSYASVMSTGGIRPGLPGSSKLYDLITETDPNDRMPPPPRNPLTQQQKDLIFKWIQQGAQDLVCQNMCDSTVFTYSGAIQNIIQNKCQGCHSSSGAQGGIDLSSYAAVNARVIDGKLWGAVNHMNGFFPMPKNGAKLSDCELTQIRKWIEAGSPNN